MSDPFASASSRLQAAIARWLTDHGVPDPATGAVELVHIVRGHGWRVVEALRPPPEARPSQGLPAEYLERKAALTRERNTPDGS
ncbi:hypothetical protein ACU635_50980 [[Actinomadura] parvosata]|uniref:hypothetical protein n=1 Tax=[Actinomadura] parvosata TaxID=1955412 RepID=UPI00406C9309